MFLLLGTTTLSIYFFTWLMTFLPVGPDLPYQVHNAMVLIFGAAGTLNSYFPINDFMLAFGLCLTIQSLVFSYQFVIWIIRKLQLNFT